RQQDDEDQHDDRDHRALVAEEAPTDDLALRETLDLLEFDRVLGLDGLRERILFAGRGNRGVGHQLTRIRGSRAAYTRSASRLKRMARKPTTRKNAITGF